MIRDRLIVGLKNQKLSEKLQMNASLTLENAAQQARQSKSVKKLKKQEVIQSGLLPTTSDVDQMEFNEKKTPKAATASETKTTQQIQQRFKNPKSKPRKGTSGCERC